MGEGYQIKCTNCHKEYIKSSYDNCKDYSYYNISTGCGMFCFNKTQLLWRYEELFENNEKMINNIKEKLSENYKFKDPIGFLPYYCENCLTLENHYYFEMKKNKIVYKTEYECKICDNKLKTVKIIRTDLTNNGHFGRPRINYIEIDLKLKYQPKIVFDGSGYIRDFNNFEIIDKEKKIYKLICKKCQNNEFEIMLNKYWD